MAFAQEASETVAFDSGAIIALSRDDARAYAILTALRKSEADIIVPAPVLAEVLRGTPRDAAVHRILKSFDADKPTSADAARTAGIFLGRSSSNAERTVDALIIATAVEHGATSIVTRDGKDFRALAPPQLTVLGL